MSIKSDIIIEPILTEKMTKLQEELNKYAFKVHRDANKHEIKTAVERKFNVKVKKVNIINVKGKVRRMTVRSGGRVIRTEGKTSSWKKAIITLEKDYKIDFYQGETAV